MKPQASSHAFKHTPGQWSAGKPRGLTTTSFLTAAQPALAADVYSMTPFSKQTQMFMSTALERNAAKYGHSTMTVCL